MLLLKLLCRSYYQIVGWAKERSPTKAAVVDVGFHFVQPNLQTISQYEELICVIRGDSVQRKTAPIIQINHDDLLENYDWEPRIKYLSLTEMIIDIADWIEYPYG